MPHAAYPFVPAVDLPEPDLTAHVDALSHLLGGKRLVVLTGAGCSTESGIPDYRGPETRRRARNPIRASEFLKDPAARRRYWARAFVGYERFARRSPNAAHHALATLESAGVVSGVITQNVDGLHEQAGSRNVIALHGRLSRVACLLCGLESDREALQARLRTMNPDFVARRGEQAPDGDAELPSAWVEEFAVADCSACGGALKPCVVFFGENVPKSRVEDAFRCCDDADAMLVVGSSLMVYSGLRFVRRMAQRQAPIALINVGESRADELMTMRVSARAGQVLPALLHRLL